MIALAVTLVAQLTQAVAVNQLAAVDAQLIQAVDANHHVQLTQAVVANRLVQLTQAADANLAVQLVQAVVAKQAAASHVASH